MDIAEDVQEAGQTLLSKTHCSRKRGSQMTATQRTKLTLTDLMNAANKHYDDSYLSVYFDMTTGRLRAGSGDSLAEFIVKELRENFDGESSRERQVAAAVQVLEGAREDIQNAIRGLKELEPRSRANIARNSAPTLLTGSA
jgi:hypothetical protein